MNSRGQVLYYIVIIGFVSALVYFFLLTLRSGSDVAGPIGTSAVHVPILEQISLQATSYLTSALRLSAYSSLVALA